MCYRCFSFEHGGLIGDIHEYLLNHMDWDGRGILVEIKTTRFIPLQNTHQQENT